MTIKFNLDCDKDNTKEEPTEKDLELITGIFTWLGYKFKHLIVEVEENGC